MKMKCLYRSIVRGDLVKPGQTLDLTEEECGTDMIRAHFVAVEEAAGAGKGKPSPAAGASAPSPTGAAKVVVVAGLTRAEAMLRLQRAGHKIPANISDARLAERFGEAFSVAAGDAAGA